MLYFYIFRSGPSRQRVLRSLLKFSSPLYHKPLNWEPHPSNFYLLSALCLCVYVSLYVCQINNQLNLSKEEIYYHNLSIVLLTWPMRFILLIHYMISTAIYTGYPQKYLPDFFYVVVFWEAPLYYTFCHHGNS